MKMKHYVVGFLFNKSLSNVLLSKKNRPMKVIENLKWVIPFCLPTTQMPIMLQQGI